jgi:transcriptional regulator with XRE-family HTH domain
MIALAARPSAKIGKPHRKASQEVRRRLSTNLKRLREARGYTQRELARLCGFRNTYISNVEQGTVNIGLANLEALVRGLECAEEDLLRTVPASRGISPLADEDSSAPRSAREPP